MVYMSETEIQNAAYDIHVVIVDGVGGLGYECTYCGEAACATQLSYSTDCGTERETHFHDLCMRCVVPVIDSVSYLDETMPITLEVARVATARPF